MNSIRASLVMMLIAAFTLVSFLAALNGYLASMGEAELLLDRHLTHSSELLQASDATPSAALTTLDEHDAFAFQVWWKGELMARSSTAPDELIAPLEEGFRYANFNGHRWRVLANGREGNRWVIVAERADFRHQLAESVVLESVLPLVLWLPASAILIWILVGWGLRPLKVLSNEINRRRSDDLTPIQQERPQAELVQLIGSTNALLARLSAAFEREKHFASHAAHELRTPLSVLKVHLHNLADELPTGHETLEHANAGLQRMHHLVEQILDLNRTNPEIIEGNFTQLDLHSLSQQVTAAAWPRFAERDQHVELEGAAVFIRGDEVLLQTLLQNLLDNANKYTPKGGEILLLVDQHAGRGRLRVEDSGPGIAEGERSLIFQRFYRSTAGTQDAVGGSGLGMAIVQHIVQLHGAKITLDSSRFDSGLAVTVEFDLWKEEP